MYDPPLSSAQTRYRILYLANASRYQIGNVKSYIKIVRGLLNVRHEEFIKFKSMLSVAYGCSGHRVISTR